ncbi:MAG: PQQ-binding-like beta-propeller repeat protein [Candidatus Helarchaeota archaeon]|nr:PQQ-binding-like beta-propeller repeat protein [Candidatus Helarchaeota archaeon]
MEKRHKLISVGILAILLSVFVINGFVQVNLINTFNNNSTLGSGNSPYPTFGNSDMNYTVIYGHPTELSVSKTESVTIDLFPNGTIKSQKVNIGFTFENEAEENCSFDLIDRLEECDLDTIKFQKGTFPAILPYEVLKSDEDFGVIVLKWSNLSVSANSRAEYGYTVVSYKAVPLVIDTEYYVNGSRVDINPLKNEINASVGSTVSNIIRIRNIQSGLFSTSSIVKPTSFCLVTLILPYEEEEADRDLADPIFSPAPITTNIIAMLQQVSWLALGAEYTINWTTVVLKGGGWGIIELQPLRIDVVQSADLTGLLFDGISALLGVLAAQQAYWSVLTVMAMIEELTGMVGVLQVLLNDLSTQLGMLTMVNYSLIDALLMGLIELDLTKTSVQQIYTALSTLYTDSLLPDYGYIDAICIEMRRILGLDIEGLGTNGVTGLGVPYMSLPLILDYYSDVERRIIASFGAQIIELLGNPAVLNLTDTSQGFRLLLNATITRFPDNTNDFYVLIDIYNLQLPIVIATLNLTRQYEFELNDIPGDRTIFNAIDNYFGSPGIPVELFPLGYQAPGSPGSSIPGFYTWMLDLLQVGRSAVWWTIGNLTRSLATLMLLLDSSFSAETLGMLDAVLTGASIDSSIPITLEAGFQGISDLTNIFSGLQEQFNSPFGSLFGDLIPDMSSFSVPATGSSLELLNNFGFYTALKLYLEPVPRLRNLLNITLPLNFGNTTAGGLSGMGGIGFAKAAENGVMGNWNWTSTGLTTVNVIQRNLGNTSMYYKQIQFKATGNVTTGTISLNRNFNYTIPATQVLYRFRTNITAPILSLVVISENATGHDVYAIREQSFSNFSDGWHEFSVDLRQANSWTSYDPSFEVERIKGVQLWITPKNTSAARVEVDYLNLTRSILPYPYDLTILDNYLIGDGVEILPNFTMREKWTSGLSFTDLKLKDLTGDGIEDILAGSNDHTIYLLNGKNGTQIWNFTADGAILAILVEDVSGDSSPEILIGTDNATVFILNKDGSVVRTFSVGSSLDRLIFHKLTATGLSYILVGRDNTLSVFNDTGTLYWNRTLKGTINDLVVADVNGDGYQEIGVATSKYKIYLLNGTNGNVIWDIITEESPTSLKSGNFRGDSKKELLYSTDQDYCVILDVTAGAQVSQFTTNSAIGGLYTANLTGDSFDDIIISTGLITPYNLSAIAGNTFNLLWNFISPLGFSIITPINYLPQNYDEVIVSTINNSVYLLNGTSGAPKYNFAISRSVNRLVLSDLTQDGVKEFIFAASNNHILTINGTSRKSLWMVESGREIITFQFIRTTEKIQLLYNLPDPFSSMLEPTGFSLFSGGDLSTLGALDISIGMTSAGGLGGLGSIDLSSLNFTSSDLPLKGIGLLNMLEMEISLIASLQDMKAVSGSQKAFTGIYEVRYTEKDTLNYQLYPVISDDTNAKYVQYKIRNYEELPIMVHHFALNITQNGQPLPLERITIEGWNGTAFVDLGNNPIYNISMAELGLNYTDGILLFKPYLEVEELEKVLLTIDWMDRELRVKVNTTGIPPSELSIEPWIDVSIELPGITSSGVTTVLTYSKTIPTYLVSAIPIPNKTNEAEQMSLLELIVTSPTFWAFFSIVLVSVMTFGYMQHREQKAVKMAASTRIVSWLKRREKSWRTLLNARIISEDQYFGLRRIRYRIKKENLVKNQLETAFERVLHWKLIGDFISTVLLVRFWRDVNQKSRLIGILLTLEHMVTAPLKQAWMTFKTTLGYLNPWDLDRQRKKDLVKKATTKRYWKKIEPPRKPIRKKHVEIISPSQAAPEERSETRRDPQQVKKKKGWTGAYRYDGGKLIEKISSAKKLPPIGSRDGQLFYLISKRKFVGITLKELAKALDLPDYEVLLSLIRLYEKGLIFMLQEGKSLNDDLWDVTGSLRKYDSELEKLIESTEAIEDDLSEGIEVLETEVKNEKQNSKESYIDKLEPEPKDESNKRESNPPANKG